MKTTLALILTLASMGLMQNAQSAQALLKPLGRPSGFVDASDKILKSMGMPEAYGTVVGEDCEMNEIWMLESTASFEQSKTQLLEWMHKHKLELSDSECYGETNQQCEFRSFIEPGAGFTFKLASNPDGGVLLILNSQGPESAP